MTPYLRKIRKLNLIKSQDFFKNQLGIPAIVIVNCNTISESQWRHDRSLKFFAAKSLGYGQLPTDYSIILHI